MIPVLADRSLGHVPDADLLLRFVRDGDRAVFELLVRRHWRLVFGVCRRVAGNVHDAEDAAQAAFLVLVRRAEVVRGTHLAAWLARVAYRCAVRVRARHQRHHSTDLSTVPAPEPVTSDPDLAAALDAELDRLPAKYRVPVVLCYLQGRTYEQAAAELNCPVGTLSGWLTRAKVLLRTRLVRRGVTVSIGGLTVFLDGLGSRASATDHAIRATTATAVAFAHGEAVPGRASAIANGVIQMMTWKSKLLPAALGAVALLVGLTAAAVSFEPPPEASRGPVAARPPEAKRADADALQGLWVFDASSGKNASLGMAWRSRVVIRGDAVTVEPFLDEKLVLRGKIELDPAAEPKRFDLVLEELDFAPAGAPLKIAAGRYPGVYKLDGERLSVCFATEPGGPRPASVDDPGERLIRATLAKAPPGFKEFPKEVTVKAVGADGKPVVGAVVARLMNRRPHFEPRTPDGRPIPPEKVTEEQRKRWEQFNRVPEGGIRDPETGWTFFNARTTDADGTVKVLFDEWASDQIVVRDPVSKRVGNARMSPAMFLASSTVTVTLQPECRVLATVRCEELTKAGRTDYFHSIIETPDGRQIASTGNEAGKLEYLLPPGDYTLALFGTEWMVSKRVKITVPKDRNEHVVEPVDLLPNELLKLLGQPAPELTDVAGWKGKEVKLADLKGKFVLLAFCSYGCGDCIDKMPAVMDLYDRVKDKGVAIVGVHVDADGEVGTAKAFDEKHAIYKKDIWKGRDIPFPVALTSLKPPGGAQNASRGGPVAKYGISSSLRTILIDPDGKVVGRFDAAAKEAAERLEELLKEAKK
ncbi:sigma-70 family RNA polymerase sigma factor [Gemmata sp. G18]|uniref:Sigma-70 family RNA polymerase sigma factor n=1 Tax=Gemmata palustris TaxID=2822762 RepID=A0ABS5BJP7_9BACT|nr:sigma-70 family RNA polymerase sigma factor [Gemmata palustris]MBP3953918.1 sigma-70 family RNA polymerase sigma factor [Gemmata palustris]